MKRVWEHLRPYLIVICGLGILLMVTSLSGVAYYNQTLRGKDYRQSKNQESKNSNSTQSNKELLNSPTFSNSAMSSDDVRKSSAGPTATVNNSSSGSISNPPQQDTHVTLYINNVNKGQIHLDSGMSQCQVLSQALQQGAIQSLDMRYSEQYNTMAVYVINGLGEANEIWWAYRVNGKPPPFGCSKMIAQNGDQVVWSYVK